MHTHTVTRFWDWRISGDLKPVKNQGKGDYCFAFASCAAVEFLYHRHPDFGQRVLLFPQDIWNNLVYLNRVMADSPSLEILQQSVPLNERQVKMRIETIIPVLRKNMEHDVYHYGPVIVDVNWNDEMNNISGDVIYRGPRLASAFDPELISSKMHTHTVTRFWDWRINGDLKPTLVLLLHHVRHSNIYITATHILDKECCFPTKIFGTLEFI
ncbi:uncharacterized protein LOC131642694 [Vicia villosa]|uniref:uncharacterized protein LOC131642694 n=1 Tax=Vicia villosa TaxID=3911 RepID=UPI00273AFC39|nr:uncharacterized protein LOC131642694 [Vicia villosa]